MYLWKAWHDSRSRVVIYILAAVSVGMLFGLDLMSWANWHAYWMTLAPVRLRSSFNFDMEVTFYTLDWLVLDYGPIAVLLVGLSLGASSVGREYGAGTMNFVLTRPSRRKNFVLTDWTLGLTAMVIILSGLAFPVVPFLCLVHAKGPGNVLAGLPALWVLGAAIYGLSHFATLVAGSAAKGLILSAATIMTYSFLPTALNEWWHADALLRATDWTLRAFKGGSWPLSPFDWSVTAFWLAVAAGFLGASLAWIRFREV
jgi:ABC-type transport system involved in multi-copper enzyme maturation permease subunit